MVRSLVLVAVWLWGTWGSAQLVDPGVHYSRSITEEGLRKDLTVIASDDMAGRDTGEEGQKKAAAFLVERFKEIGTDPIPDALERGMIDGYQQRYGLDVVRLGAMRLFLAGKELIYGKQQFYALNALKGDRSESTITVMQRKNRDASTGQGADGAVFVLYDQEDERVFEDGRGLMREFGILGREFSARGWELGFLVIEDPQAIVARYPNMFHGARMELAKGDTVSYHIPSGTTQFFVIDRASFDVLMDQAGKKAKKWLKGSKKQALRAKADVQVVYAPDHGRVWAENVLGYVEGGSKKEELIVVSAHYDHIGVMDGTIYNGADDNGSGTAALLAMADVFMDAKRNGRGPMRSVLFLAVSGEERGLLGSQYYSENPVFDLGNTVADLNVDMIGRVDTIERSDDAYIYIIGSDRLSTELHAVNEKANEAVGLELDYRYNAEDDPNNFYYRSDHYNFVRYGIPSIFYFSGVHADYHGPNDVVERIRFDLVRKRTQLVFLTAWELANRAKRIQVDVQ